MFDNMSRDLMTGSRYSLSASASGSGALWGYNKGYFFVFSENSSTETVT